MSTARAAVVMLMLLVIFSSPAAARLNPDLASPNIVINLPSRTLEFFSGTNLIKVYPVAVGKPSTPTPLGEFTVFDKQVNPAWYPPRTGEVIPSGPHNPLGYRWMEIAPLVGVHGTNAPWAIGLAVSNGCIRMHEEDVEELYEVVPYGTPVRVTYDRVKVMVKDSGEVSLGIYPDIYGYHTVSTDEVREKLRSCGLNGWLSDAEIERMIADEADRQVVFARVHGIRVNGRALVERAVSRQGSLFLPAWPVAEALGINIAWDEASLALRNPQRSVPGVVRGDRVYVTDAAARQLFGGQQVFRQEENVYALDVLRVFLNGRQLFADVQNVDGVLALPALLLAEALGFKAVPASDGVLTVQGAKVPCSFIGDVPYIQLTRIYDAFGAYVYWNQEARMIELTYPFDVKEGND